MTDTAFSPIRIASSCRKIRRGVPPADLREIAQVAMVAAHSAFAGEGQTNLTAPEESLPVACLLSMSGGFVDAFTIDQAAAPHSSLAFMFWGEGLFVFPLMLLYTAIGFRVFRGKFTSAPGHY